MATVTPPLELSPFVAGRSEPTSEVVYEVRSPFDGKISSLKLEHGDGQRDWMVVARQRARAAGLE
jgi:hypothetical protein